MTEKEILKIFEQVGAIITDSHIVYTSGKHGSAYVNKDALYPHTRIISALCKEIADHFWGRDIEVVASPAIGGVVLAQWVAHHYHPYDHQPQILAVFAEKEGDKMTFRRGYDKYIPGKNVLVVEDVLTTGGSVKKTIEAIKELGGKVIGCGVLCNRGGVTAELLEVPELFALTNIPLEAWPENECPLCKPLCKEGKPINTSVGKGREYLKKKGLV